MNWREYRVLLSISLLLLGCKSNNKHSYSSAVVFNAQIQRWTNNKLTITTELVNNTDSTLNYLTMSCDSLVVYQADHKGFMLVPKICEKNYPVNASLSPHSSLKREIKLLYTGEGRYQDTSLKIGFNLFHDDRSLFSEHAGRVIWSKNLLSKY